MVEFGNKKCKIERVGANGYNYLFFGDTLYCDDCMRLTNSDVFLRQTLQSYGYNTIVYCDYNRGIHCKDEKSWENYAKILLDKSLESGITQINRLKKPLMSSFSARRRASSQNQGVNNSGENGAAGDFEQTLDSSETSYIPYEEQLKAKIESVKAVTMQNTRDQIENITTLLESNISDCKIAIIADGKWLEMDFHGYNDLFNNALDSWSKNQKNMSLFLWVFNEGNAKATYDLLLKRAQNDAHGFLGKRLIYLTDLAKLSERRSEENPRPLTISETHFPMVDELKNYLNRLRILGKVKYDINELQALANCLYAICRRKQYRLSDLHMEFNKISDPQITCASLKSFFNIGDVRTAEEQLNDIIGMEEIKKVVDDIKKQYSYKNNSKESGFVSRLETPTTKVVKTKDRVHFCLYGNPGTGKSTVAGILGQVLNEIGYLSSGHLVKCPATSLSTGYYGASARLMSEKVEEALGGVLFIDDIASILSQHPAEKDEINGILLDAMTSYSDLCVIIAGYPEPTRKYLESDAGLARRFTYPIDLPDYSEEELAKIFIFKAEKDGYTVDNSFKKILPELFKKMKQSLSMREKERWGNAGTADNLYLEMRRTADGRGEKEISRTHLPNIFSYGTQKFNIDNLLNPRVVSHDSKSRGILSFDMDAIKNQINPCVDSSNVEYFQETVLAIQADGGEGTGFLITADGLALTCAHVVSGKTNITARVRRKLLYGGYFDIEYRCVVVKEDRSADITLIRLVENLQTNSGITEKFPYIKLEDDIVDIEYPSLTDVYIVGYPGGVSKNDNVSVFSGKIGSRQFKNGIEVYMLDITAIKGNSGSPIIDMSRGVVIGFLIGSDLYPGEGLTEELNKMNPIKYAWNLMRR